MRPTTSISPCSSSVAIRPSSTSLSVHPGAGVAGGVHRSSAEQAGGTAGLDELSSVGHEGRHLGAGETYPDGRRPIVVLLGGELLEHDDDPVGGLVVGDADGADGPQLLGGRLEPEVAGGGRERCRFEVVQQAV